MSTYSNLRVCSLTPDQHRQTCGYWYTVTDSSTAHTAFARRESLMHALRVIGKPNAALARLE